jgi:hypothetical protein
MGRPRKFTDTEKWCSTCQQWLPLSEFGKNKTTASGLQDRCKTCSNTLARPRKPRTKEQRLKARLKTKYGITLEEYDQMLKAQNGKCAICGTRKSGNKQTNRLAVDHDHETGFIRGLLCSACNSGLGNFKDKTQFLAKAILYLETHNGN